jgi:hypothetical protein
MDMFPSPITGVVFWQAMKTPTGPRRKRRP